jgi:O-antigen ligase
MSLDLAPYLRALPGFSLNFDNPAIIDRAALNRVAGTAIHPIELGVVAGMLLPLAIYLGISDTDRSARRRWAPVALIGLAVPISVSRSAVLALVLALVVLVVLMPAPQRLAALFVVPLGLVAVFMSAPGLIGTLASFFGAGSKDPSVATRLDDYPLVERLVQEAPWFGHGGGTYIVDNALDILDNQYLKTAIELGLVGVVALIAYFLVPVIAALVARGRSRDPELRLLCAALAGAGLAAGASSLLFDSLSFPMFSNVHALVIGLIGAAWRLAPSAEAAATGSSGGTVPAGGG